MLLLTSCLLAWAALGCEGIPKASLDGKCIRSQLRNEQFERQLFDDYGDVYNYTKYHYCENLQNYPISCEQYLGKATYDQRVRS